MASLLPVVELLRLVMRLAGEVHPEAVEDVGVDVREYDGGVHVAAGEGGERVHGLFGVGVGDGADAERYEHLVGVQARVVVAHVLGLEVLYGLDDARGDERNLVRYAAEVFERVQEAGAARAEQGGGFACDNMPVRHLHGDGGRAGLLRAAEAGRDDGQVVRLDAQLVHEELLLIDLALLGEALAVGAFGGEVAAYDLAGARFAAGRVVGDAEAGHVDAHVRGALVGALAVNPLEHRVEDGENLDVAVIVHGALAVVLEVEGVYHVDVVEVGGRGLVGEVDGVLERQVPDREGLELRVARLHAALVLVIELRQAGGHLAAAGAGRGDDDELARRLYVVVLAEAVVGDDKGEVGGIVRYPVLHIDAHVHGLQALAEDVGGLLAAVVRDADAAHVEADGAEGVYEPEGVLVVGDAEVPAALAALHVVGRDDYHYLRLVLHLEEHAHLAVRLEARQHARGVVVVEELAAELQVELPAEAADALAYLLRLEADVFLVVKAYPVHIFTPPEKSNHMI